MNVLCVIFLSLLFECCAVYPLSAGGSCGPCLQHGLQELPALKWLIQVKPVVTWHDYVHVLLMESGNVARAAIHRIKDGACLAATDDLEVTQEQVLVLLAGFDDCTKLHKDGIWLDSDHFTLTRITDRRIMVGRDARTGAGCVIYRCVTCVIVVCYEDGNHPGGCYSLVTRLGDFLVESGF